MDGFGFLFGLVVAAVAAYWVYKDAKSRGVGDPAGWGFDAPLTQHSFATLSTVGQETSRFD
jgi:hypothetical protein